MVIAALSLSCLLGFPADGPVVRGFAPEGLYGGHWGMDIAVAVGSPVRAAAGGVVTFSGQVAGRASITISHGGSVRTSYSYLSSRSVAQGQHVGAGEVIGRSGVDHGVEAVHFSLRLGDVYLDPAGAGCGSVSPGRGVWLVAAA